MTTQAFIKRVTRYRWGYAFVAPWVLLYLAFGIYPLFLYSSGKG